ncbi:SDR family oxidoreductase [Sphingobium sp. 3R8]|uniref:SDR family oxidoreductase n=1 Tax=Sphingobium sp. 3R8 TaxID=2874921 RepID=UPI001CCCD74D|nr:SDR family oxidoreductase [Sphingobium sp. 3R8]MBZ9646881.1 SDR family oxidoreductase [Sphingobium sp. 3R8]
MDLKDLMYRADLMAGQKILITGGGTGLGRVMAEAALLLGAQVVIAGRRIATLEATAAELEAAHGGCVIPLACDIRDPDSIEAMLDGAWQGRAPTGLINNAAGNFISRTEDLSPKGFDAVANIVFRGSFLTTLACGKRWLAAGDRASVVSIVTTWVWNGSPFVVPSAMSKAGVAAMTQSLSVEWGGRGIRFNAIAPGPFPTEGMTARLKPGEGSDAYADMSANPIGRVGRMPELANLAVYLLHPGSEYVNGQVIAIDGGDFQATGGNFSGLRSWTDDQWREARTSIRKTDAKQNSATPDN